MTYSNKSGLWALLLTSAAAFPAGAAEWNVRVGGYYNAMVAYAKTDLPAGNAADFDGVDVSTNTEVFFLPSITLDNGIQIGFNMQLEGEGTTGEQIDESFVQIRGSFGEVLIGSENGSFTNSRIVQNGGSGSCNNALNDNHGITYFSPAFAGFNFGAEYTADIGGRRRGSMATERFGNVVNPAFRFDTSLEGLKYQVGTQFCLDTGRVLPTTIGISLGESMLSGSDAVWNLPFPDGLGVTSMGGVPGVFINSPTDIQSGRIMVDRDSYGFSFDIEHPIRFNVSTGEYEEGIATPSGSFWRPIRRDGPSLGVLSLIGNLKYGMIKQSESVQIQANTPAFGVNSQWSTDYNTKFDSDVAGLSIGLASSQSYIGRNGATNTFRVSGSVGYDFYDVRVRDSVNATGLGGALNFSNSQVHNYDEGIFNATVSASYKWTRKNTSAFLTVGLEYGTVPEYDYRRPDSNLLGPLNPTLSLDPTLNFTIGTGISVRF